LPIKPHGSVPGVLFPSVWLRSLSPEA